MISNMTYLIKTPVITVIYVTFYQIQYFNAITALHEFTLLKYVNYCPVMREMMNIVLFDKTSY